jgi:integrase/recombinase XerD
MNTTVENFLASHPLADETKATYRPLLEELTAQAFESWDAADLVKFVTRENWGNSRQYVALCAARKFIRWKCGHNHAALTARIKRVKSKKQRALTLPQVKTLLDSFDIYTEKGCRDMALAALALDTGLRESELARLKLADIDFETCTLQVTIKGGDPGAALFSVDTAMIIDQWLQHRRPAPGAKTLFVSLAPNKHNGQPLTKWGVKAIFKSWGIKLGWKLSPHDARRTFATIATRLGAPSRTVQIAGRWSKIDMVQKYTENLELMAIAPYLPITAALNR